MSEQNMTLEIASLRNENAVLKEELALAKYPPNNTPPLKQLTPSC